MTIFNSYSRLNKIKIQHGLRIKYTNATNLYVIVSKINKYLSKYIEDVDLKCEREPAINIRVFDCMTKVDKLSKDELNKVMDMINKGESFDDITSYIYKA